MIWKRTGAILVVGLVVANSINAGADIEGLERQGTLRGREAAEAGFLVGRGGTGHFVFGQERERRGQEVFLSGLGCDERHPVRRRNGDDVTAASGSTLFRDD